MAAIPNDRGLDNTLALMRDPYRFVARRCDRYGTDLFRTRIMFRSTVCMTGPAAAQLFYDPERFVREGAAPEPVRATLFGKGGVQGLDGEAHRHRKRMLMSLVTPERVSELAQICAQQWQVLAAEWSVERRIVLYDKLQELLTSAVCAWAGVPLIVTEVSRRSRDLSALFDRAGSAGPGHLKSRLARKRCERWIGDLVREIRAGRSAVPSMSAADVIASHRQIDGTLLEPRIAAVEILNVLRPTVANAVYVVFAAHALHAFPLYRKQIASGGARELFVQEVRRFYPFFPAVMARTRTEFEWAGYRFPAHIRVMLDLYGTNHDSRSWEAPNEFRPERFRKSDPTAFSFIPQGGGDHQVNHRCPGEGITIELLKVALEFLTQRLQYDVPHQELEIHYSRLPALPRSRFIIENVKFA